MFAKAVPRRGVLVWSLLFSAVASPRVCGAGEYLVEPLWSNTIRGPAYAKLDGLVIFEGSEDASSNLYATDGTSVDELSIAGIEDADPERVSQGFGGGGHLEPFKGDLYFVADGPDARTLYKTDGRDVTPVASGVSGMLDYDVYLPPVAKASDDHLYFERETGEDRSLYKTDGISVMSAEIGPPGSTRFFTSFQGDAILHSSGADGGTLFREDDRGRTEIAFDQPISRPGLPTPFRGDLFFTAHDDRGPWSAGGRRLFRTDGTSIMEIVLPDIAQRIDSFAVAGDRLYFKADLPSLRNESLRFERVWHTDGNTVEVLDLEWEDQHATRFIGNVGNDAYFFEYAQRRIIRTDGESIVEMDVDLRPDVGNFDLKGIVGDTLLLELQVADLGVPFSVTRGFFVLEDDAATFVDIGHGDGYTTDEVTLFGHDVYFTAGGRSFFDLFKLSDGEVTELEINPDESSAPGGLTVIDDTLYLSAVGPMGRELYATDGESLTLIDINPNGDSNPRILEHLDGTLLVVADAGRGRELLAITRDPLAGDYDGNGLVDQADLDLVLAHWGDTAVPARWAKSLPIGPVDQQELDRVLVGWGSDVVATAAAVPEPGTAALLVAMVLVAIGRFRRVETRG